MLGRLRSKIPGTKEWEAEVRKRSLANFHTWSLRALETRERGYGVNDMHAIEIRAEIKRRHDKRTRRYTLAAVTAAAISAFGSMVAAVANLMAVRSK